MKLTLRIEKTSNDQEYKVYLGGYELETFSNSYFLARENEPILEFKTFLMSRKLSGVCNMSTPEGCERRDMFRSKRIKNLIYSKSREDSSVYVTIGSELGGGEEYKVIDCGKSNYDLVKSSSLYLRGAAKYTFKDYIELYFKVRYEQHPSKNVIHLSLNGVDIEKTEFPFTAIPLPKVKVDSIKGKKDFMSFYKDKRTSGWLYLSWEDKVAYVVKSSKLPETYYYRTDNSLNTWVLTFVTGLPKLSKYSDTRCGDISRSLTQDRKVSSLSVQAN